MTKKEIKEYLDEQVEFHCQEFGIEREAALEVVFQNNYFEYFEDFITLDDLAMCADYLGFNFDRDLAIESKEAYKANESKNEKRRQKRAEKAKAKKEGTK